MTPGKFWGFRRMADEAGRFKMLAVDQRPPIKTKTAAARGEDQSRYGDVRAVKRALMEALAPQASAVLADPTYALCDAMSLLLPHHGLVVTLEDSVFGEGADGRLSKGIDDWSVSKIKRAGADSVKVLTWYHPEQDAASRQAQLDFTKRVGEACARYDIAFLLEMLLYPLAGDAGQTKDYVEQAGKRADHVLKTVEVMAAPDYGVDVFKLESPIPAKEVPPPGDRETAALFEEMGRLAGRPWVMLSAGATQAAFRNVLHYAFEAGASGFLAGRAIWWDAFQHFPDMDRMAAELQGPAAAYMAELNAFADAKAQPWTNWFDDARPEGWDSEWMQGDYPDLEGRL
ncbi:tagatose 1,6-diphosphate aldolase [Pelagibius litoralis]|uniref:Tagatose 1,6-diphosphate aldolase n=1 Tax=Pelagibius litoralis TaxID=374515 RepID=A0A967KAD2_9PROT|nr:tagatose 1,6-diphosphate aldolase [Pelagibius litoralis]NIA69794.1 tagatose 1,6-diphosphate aldolase [Pelagibius litoralis]